MKESIEVKKIIEFYKKGFFPMAKNLKSNELNFYRPYKRLIIPINNFHVPKKLFREFKKNKYKFKINNNFKKVINLCQNIKRKDKETWINDIIANTYFNLFKYNKCHSIECYESNQLIGGLYGVHLGSCFFGESMFSLKNNVSKLCLLYLIAILKKNYFSLLDSQFYNKHLIQFGAYEISNKRYLSFLKKGLEKNTNFNNIENFQEVLSIIQSINHKS